eukprot:NODE_250_length_12902_cov_0.423182.p3 type:complete len:284 gc:universal NODE_250_length_12902_cov_0.423182:12624-11773(-)
MSLSTIGKLVGEIGHGSFGTVYKMMDTDGKELAVKEIKRDEWSLLEVDIQSRCCHPNILPINKVIKSNDNIYVVMPCCEYDVYSLMNSFMIMDSEVKSYFSEIVDAVCYLHDKSIYHRDIKPENIMIYKKRALLADFGLACTDRYVSDECGTSMFCAPEVSAGSLYDASKQDMWSLGLLLINLLCGEDPWPSTNDEAFKRFTEDPKAFLLTLYPFSDGILSVLTKLLNLDPKQRITARELQLEFKKIEKFADDIFHWDEAIDIKSDDKIIVGSWDSAFENSPQ